ncbi:MAG: zinc ribbon domain-containing protein [bacterium]|nr:zinc ribbon domain-containing protein [bacterium]
MPVYSYKCKKCGKEFDLLVGVGKGDEELKCQKCGSKNLERLLSPCGVRVGSLSSSSSDIPSCPTCQLPPK